jgi:hypothetical protein
MMLCCMLAALILAHAVAMVRRWGIFWGVVSPHEWENPETVFSRIGAWLARPKVKRAVFAVAVVEFAALVSWVYVAHGTHVYQLGDQALGRLRGEEIVYAGVCGRDGKDQMVRMVLNRAFPGQELTDAS